MLPASMLAHSRCHRGALGYDEADGIDSDGHGPAPILVWRIWRLDQFVCSHGAVRVLSRRARACGWFIAYLQMLCVLGLPIVIHHCIRVNRQGGRSVRRELSG